MPGHNSKADTLPGGSPAGGALGRTLVRTNPVATSFFTLCHHSISLRHSPGKQCHFIIWWCHKLDGFVCTKRVFLRGLSAKLFKFNALSRFIGRIRR